MSLLSERHLKTVVINMLTSYSRHMSCHGYEGVMSVLCTALQVNCYPIGLIGRVTRAKLTSLNCVRLGSVLKDRTTTETNSRWCFWKSSNI